MPSKTRRTLAVAFAAAIFGAPPALAMPGTGGDLRGESAASLSESVTPPAGDLRGEHAASISETATPSSGDQRSPDAREPVGGVSVPQPVVVEVTDPDAGGFDWTAAIIGMTAGLAVALLAAVGVAGSRRRPTIV